MQLSNYTRIYLYPERTIYLTIKDLTMIKRIYLLAAIIIQAASMLHAAAQTTGDSDKTCPAEKSCTFSELLDTFTPWQKADLTAAILDMPDNGKHNNNGIDSNLVKKYIGPDNSCGCVQDHLWWRALYSIQRDNYIILFITQECDYPVKERCMYADMMIYTYTKDGKQIDSATLYRGGDYYQHRFVKGSLNPFSITVEQTEIEGDINDKATQTTQTTQATFTIGNDGHITRSFPR